MKRFLILGLALGGILVSGCRHAKPTTSPPAHPTATTIVTPDNSLAGKVFSYNSVGRFVVLNFPSRKMPALNQRLFLYRGGLKVAEVKITGPQNDDNIVADLISGDARTGDGVREQ